MKMKFYSMIFHTCTYMPKSVYNTCTLLLNNKKYNVDANLDAPDNVISLMNISVERVLSSNLPSTDLHDDYTVHSISLVLYRSAQMLLKRTVE